jgi:c-di-GMP-binding flagellar brake protein YcgR
MEERRKACRIKLDLTINYSLKESLRINNLSATGLNFSSTKEFKQKDFLVLTFSLETDREIKVIGKVVRVNPLPSGFFEYGLEFWQMENTDSDYIDRYVRAMNAKNGILASAGGNA